MLLTILGVIFLISLIPLFVGLVSEAKTWGPRPPAPFGQRVGMVLLLFLFAILVMLV
jgi:hypothetical protein